MTNRATQFYDFTLAANASQTILAEGSYYKILTSTGALRIRRDGGSGIGPITAGHGERNAEYKRLTITDLSGAGNSGIIVVADADFVDEQLALSAASLASLSRPESYTGFSNVITALAAVTAEQVVAPAANTGGIVVQSASATISVGASTPAFGGLLAKNGAPANVGDGLVVAACQAIVYDNVNTILYSAVDMQNNVLVPAGLGLYWFFSSAVAVNQPRAVRYKLL